MVEERAAPHLAIRRIEADDTASGFRCGKHALDDYFARHALSNDQAGIGRAYVLGASPEDIAAGLPAVLGFYILSMAVVVSADIASAVSKRLPRYPMPVALIGRLAVDERARGRRLGETLLMDALNRIVGAAEILGCLGVIVDAKDEDAEQFYAKYDFVALPVGPAGTRRLFLSIDVARAAFAPR
jgi:GNAT superfamily N-acetyltransferase